jgi:uncharacterized protein YndB with AHSA1/START domain
MDARVETHTDADARELVIERVFDAPRSLVWEAWTKREHQLQWGAPHGFTVIDCGGDLRPGGRWHSTMRSPDGKDHRNGGVYREVVEPERLVYTFAWYDEDGKPGIETVVTITLAEAAGKTRMVFRQTGFDTVSARDGHSDGWSQSFERLAGHLRTM